ncbi:Cytidine deaminase [Pelotomaculum propionicicum]|uniref:Cytidine deaminase n=1 Tax=Pelotomaculum propionicicum TaxID=258475 RepID=A0A4Y7RS88_9FIRM|nr:cytidine deaminase [Peptococcaceae bacterium]TEB11542.1 Cytidine deaminase [Pelotomaculum propionicicum]
MNVIFPVEKLINAAVAARERAYAPYSNFRVGAAILTKEGRYYTGCNVENVSYGLTCCAERVALFKAVSNGERDFEAIAVTAGTEDYCAPCGACRQALAEFGAKIKVYMVNRAGDYRMRTVAELLPEAFSQETLNSEADGHNDHKTITKLIEPVNR